VYFKVGPPIQLFSIRFPFCVGVSLCECVFVLPAHVFLTITQCLYNRNFLYAAHLGSNWSRFGQRQKAPLTCDKHTARFAGFTGLAGFAARELRAKKALWQKLHRLPVERSSFSRSLLSPDDKHSSVSRLGFWEIITKAAGQSLFSKRWGWDTLAGVLSRVFILRMKWLWLVALCRKAFLETLNRSWKIK